MNLHSHTGGGASVSWVVYKLQLYLVLLVVMATCAYICCDLRLSFPFVQGGITISQGFAGELIKSTVLLLSQW